MSALLRIAGLSKRFGGLAAVDGVTLAVAEGHVHSVIGPNGAGKTTLFNLVTGAIPPDAGSVTFAGDDVTGRSPELLARGGVVRTFQRTSVFLHATAFENVRLAVRTRRRHHRALWLAKAARDAIDADAHAILASVGLERHADTPAATLAHGNQRALDLAIGVALEPRLLMMDEPLAGMAQGDRERIAQLVLKLRDERRLTIVVVEHDIGMVMRLSDRITVMQHGRVIADGTVDAIRADEAVRAAYLHGSFAA